jgi:RNA polymerase sigma-70 factor, ECF subfamily
MRQEPTIAGPPRIEGLWRDLHGRVHAFVRRRVASEADAEDIVQDVFVRLHLELGSARRIENLDAWVHRVARNAITDAYRRGARQPAASSDGEDVERASEEVDASDDPLLVGCIRPFVKALPEPYQQAVERTDLDGLTQAEAAKALGLSVSGMKSRVQRGRAQLRSMLEACCRIELDARNRVTDVASRNACSTTEGSAACASACASDEDRADT